MMTKISKKSLYILEDGENGVQVGDIDSGGALCIMFKNHVRSWPLLKTP